MKWQPIETCPEWQDVLLVIGDTVGRGKKLTRDDGIHWSFEGVGAHECIRRGIPRCWKPLPKPPSKKRFPFRYGGLGC